MEEITLTIKKWSNDELKKFNEEDNKNCGNDIVWELALLMSQHGDENLSKNDYKWMLLENLSEKHVLNSVHMIVLFNRTYFDDFFEYAKKQLGGLYQEVEEIVVGGIDK